MTLPSSGKPTAQDVVEWALDLAKRRKGVDVDGYYGMQCWDLPNYILKRYWGFTTWGNANAMAQKSNYRGYDFKIYRNTSSFVPSPGDWAVWAGSNPGHVAIVVGPSNTLTFTSVDQNWYSANWSGSPAYKIKHTYSGVTHFVRPPYKKSAITNPDVSEPPKNPENDDKPAEEPTVRFKDVTKVVYTLKRDDFGQRDKFEHRVAWGNKRKGKVKGITIKNAHTMRSVQELYNDRNQYISTNEYPHYYIDYMSSWSPRDEAYEYPDDPDNIVIEVCGDYSDDKEAFELSELWAMILGYEIFNYYDLNFSSKSIKIDDKMWRSLKEHVNWDFVKDGFPSKEKLDDFAKIAVGLYANKEKLLQNIGTEKVTKSKIKTTVKNKNSEIVQQLKNESGITGSPKITIEKSKYTFNQALNLQMSRGQPMKSVSYGWIQATRTQTSNSMEPNRIWNNSTQRYQMLNLGKYQGVPVSKLNQLLDGKGKLHNQGKAFADACKKYKVNEIYLIAHALLETGNGKSNFASGTYGVYNFFGIGAFDSNPNNAIDFARNNGWTTPAKAIVGGAKFVRQGYISKGQNTLYRMRWNPKAPATHQYATDINWCTHQATIMASYYKKIKLSGIYYIQDKYK
ncbi:glucosaminidase domain-containing protein [Staphylococcus felis]|uniref:glucosaminidase domain-containing protein n=1 Tax=Staphylococcus felis TaxID=46127 RepID=UPI0021CF9270|nr:glucosaminidase domain-containing protein [Staphylococcus felis]UXR86163.1 glucosaminidase domain-containing protein [Staphylococcus felis]